MKFLQEKYKDDNGHEITAEKVQVLAPYQHIADGFYRWQCGSCDKEHGSRACGWPISGQVLKCDGCRKMNLLVRTNCEEIDKAFGSYLANEERTKELERLRGIEKYNAEQVAKIWNEVRDTIAANANALLKGIAA